MSTIALTPQPEVLTATGQRSTSLLRNALRLWRTRIGLMMVGLLVAIALFGPFFAPHDPTAFVGIPNTGPGGDALFGTDHIGQDVWSRFLWGGREILVDRRRGHRDRIGAGRRGGPGCSVCARVAG